MRYLEDLYGKRVLVTGASGGIGAELAIGFAEYGASVLIHYGHNPGEAQKTLERVQYFSKDAAIVQKDLTIEGAGRELIEDAIDVLGGLDVLVNNAGAMGRRVDIRKFESSDYEAVMNLNVRSVVEATSTAAAHLAIGDGAVVNMGSVAGRDGGGVGAGLYGAAKACVHSLTRNMAREFAPLGVRVNAISPGYIDTEFHSNTPSDRKLQMVESIPLGRPGRAKECVGAALFLASSSMSSYMTGQIVDINGGILMP